MLPPPPPPPLLWCVCVRGCGNDDGSLPQPSAPAACGESVFSSLFFCLLVLENACVFTMWLKWHFRVRYFLSMVLG